MAYVICTCQGFEFGFCSFRQRAFGGCRRFVPFQNATRVGGSYTLRLGLAHPIPSKLHPISKNRKYAHLIKSTDFIKIDVIIAVEDIGAVCHILHIE